MVSADSQGEVPLLYTAEESEVPLSTLNGGVSQSNSNVPRSVSVGRPAVNYSLRISRGEAKADVVETSMLSSVSVSEGKGSSSGGIFRRRLSGVSPCVPSVGKNTTREEGALADEVASRGVDRVVPLSTSMLSAVEDVPRSGSSMRAGSSNQPLSAANFVSSTESTRRVFTNLYPDENFRQGTVAVPLVLVGKAHVQSVSSDAPAREATVEIMGGKELPQSVGLLRAVEEVGEGENHQSSGWSSGANSTTAGVIPRREVRFAPRPLMPTPPRHVEQQQSQHPRVRQQYDTYRSLPFSATYTSVMMPRPILRSNASASSSGASRSVFPVLQQPQQQQQPPQYMSVSPPSSSQRQSVPDRNSASQRRLGEIVTRLANSRSPSPTRVVPQLIQNRLPVVPTAPAYRDALYRLQRRQLSRNSRYVGGPTAVPPPPPPPGQQLQLPYNTRIRPDSGSNRVERLPLGGTYPTSQTGRFVGNRPVYYY
ncbi:hypothetical protein DQ04_02571070 [Trypanosoma grayi]|uniref:hypothetical protein n=1 Tax=Trypanosoma grayi TaxID=71804 RepID=UPI0004F44F16|nr:hypothetical protein DQ04_02571070 [Trypanosoma grayi]KEG11489.1 hypothetical protein DQ04_02571070 [Trypanosoma grayi]